MTKHKKAALIKAAVILAVAIVLCSSARIIYVEAVTYVAYNVKPLENSQITAAGANSTDKLMIVAHPDDETLWGGGHLMDGGYLVVCVTNGRNEKRSEEFKKVVETSGNKYLMLSYPDKIARRRDDWQKVRSGIIEDLRKVMEYKQWDLIATHNKNGEYGHIHHQLVHKFVTDIYQQDEIDTRLYCFGKYFTKSKLASAKSTLTPISAQQLKFKEKLEKIYISQTDTVQKLGHMNDYEMWEIYDEPLFTIN